jgi:hypothetical protein
LLPIIAILPEKLFPFSFFPAPYSLIPYHFRRSVFLLDLREVNLIHEAKEAPMRNSRIGTILSLVVLLLSLAATASASSAKNFRTHLSGGEEVPVVVTNAQGQAIFQLSKDGSSLRYKLIVANIENVTQAHIHLAPVGVNGSVVAWLYPSAPPAQLIPGRTNGILAEGELTSANLVGPLAGGSMEDLLNAILEGNAYVNVHTSQFPPGEIRGQIHNH